MLFSEITCVDATNFTDEVENYCADHEISTHYQNEIVFIENDGNTFADWLKEQGYKFKNPKSGDYIGIFAT